MFQEEISAVSAATTQAVSSGSFLLVAFAFASLRLGILEESFTSAIKMYIRKDYDLTGSISSAD